MKLTRRMRRAALTVVAGAASATMLVASPAFAAASWPDAGYQPRCDVANYFSTYTNYYDNSAPIIVGFDPAPYVKVNNVASPRTFATGHFRDTCSGVSYAQVDLAKNGVYSTFLTYVPDATTTEPFDVTRRFGRTVGLADVGRWTYPAIRVQDRWSEFQLSPDLKTLNSSVARPGGFGPTSGIRGSQDWSTTPTYVLRDTILSITKNHSTIKKGTAVTVRGVVRVANGTAYVGIGGAKVSLQRKYVGAKSWSTVGSDLADSSGRVSVVNKPTKSAYYRLVYTGRYAAPWNAPISTGATGRVTVKK